MKTHDLLYYEFHDIIMYDCMSISPHAGLKSIDKGSFIDMLKSEGAGDRERTSKEAKTTKVRRHDC